jgi:hypothetical protein
LASTGAIILKDGKMVGERFPAFKATPHPPFSWKLMLKPAFGGKMPAPLDRPTTQFYFRASNAIWNGIKLLKLSPDDHILFPSYHCGIERDVILKAGLKVKYYTVGRDTRISMASIRKNIDGKTKGIFIIHYFGFPQDLSSLAELCRREGLYLIEDCSHALYSRDGDSPLGTVGDLAVFSMWKMVPIPFGGALVVNRPDLPMPDEPVPPSRYEVVRILKKLFEIHAMNSGLYDSQIWKSFVRPLASMVRRANRTLSADPWRQKEIGIPEFCVERGEWGIPPISRRMLLNADEQTIVRKRRTRFLTLLDLTRKGRALLPLFTDLPKGVCPIYFPVIVNDPTVFSKYMKARNFEAIRFWFWSESHFQFPKEEYPDAAFLKTHIVVLPVHQYLSEGVFEQLCGILSEWIRDHANDEIIFPH